ncbi:MAG: hypothetical protein L0Y56_06625 [Nitrospira sp.]|nr:hypothetical protein [Nitrospira sp.]
MAIFCQRCQGLMVKDHFIDLLDDTGKIQFLGWRCLVCGEVVDPVILFNRVSPIVYKRRARRYPVMPVSRAR